MEPEPVIVLVVAAILFVSGFAYYHWEKRNDSK